MIEVGDFHAKWQGDFLDGKPDMIEVDDFHAKWQGVNLTFWMENRT